MTDIESIRNRFESKFTKTNCCWIWKGSTFSNGYGLFPIEDRQELAHRISYRLYKGEIPEGLLVCHSCDNRCCVNPEHLWLGTESDNRNDMFSKGRGPDNRGENSGVKKITAEEAIDIVELTEEGFTANELSYIYGITPKQVRLIRRRVAWTNV